MLFLQAGPKSVYDVMKGWGAVSMSAGLLFQYHEKVEQKFETTSNHFSRAIILNSYNNKKHHYHHYYHHHHHHRHHHYRHYHQFHHHYHSLSAPPGANPV